jgi:hypothetical protein
MNLVTKSNIDTFVDEAIGVITSCSRLESEADRDKVRDTLLKPLTGEYSFVKEPNGNVTMSRIGSKRHLSPTHIAAYMDRVFVEIGKYKDIVDQNKAVCSAYRTPTFEPVQARDFIKDAVNNAFNAPGVAESYQE